MTNVMEEFGENGVAVIRDFYDYESEIAPIQEAIRQIVELVAAQAGISVPVATHLEAMTAGYRAIASKDRKLGSVIYDAVKQIPEFVQLVSCKKNADLYKQLRPGALPGIAAGGYGIRIDSPGEEKFRAYWHQEFPAQLRSIDGVVFWSPLLDVTQDMGPVEVAPTSQKQGLMDLVLDDGNAGKSGAYAMRLKDEAEAVAKYKTIAPLSKPGDLIVMDFLTLHQSGQNVSDRPRWSMQLRYFNFAEPVGRSLNWSGAFAQGKPMPEILEDIKKVQARPQ